MPISVPAPFTMCLHCQGSYYELLVLEVFESQVSQSTGLRIRRDGLTCGPFLPSFCIGMSPLNLGFHSYKQGQTRAPVLPILQWDQTNSWEVLVKFYERVGFHWSCGHPWLPPWPLHPFLVQEARTQELVVHFLLPQLITAFLSEAFRSRFNLAWLLHCVT